ncbi:MAG: HNH endonuclease [Sphingobacteriales bacterium]|nr:MAG: HNH endonuclease [Sphingobacteriales bacterium]
MFSKKARPDSVFNTSDKRRLTDPLNIDVSNGTILTSRLEPAEWQTPVGKNEGIKKENSVYRNLRGWISHDPLLIYRLVYERGMLRLAKDSHAFLMDQLKNRHKSYFDLIKSKAEKWRKQTVTVTETQITITGKRKSEVNGFDWYEISELGYVYDLRNSHPEFGHMEISKSRVDRAGYLTVRLSQGGVTSTKYIHRLIAEAFVSTNRIKGIVNHRNGRKTDNSISNLEWVSSKENMAHAYRTGLIQKKVKRVVDNATGETYQSAKDAAQKLGIKYNTLRNYLNGGISKNPTSLSYY